MRNRLLALVVLWLGFIGLSHAFYVVNENQPQYWESLGMIQTTKEGACAEWIVRKGGGTGGVRVDWPDQCERTVGTSVYYIQIKYYPCATYAEYAAGQCATCPAGQMRYSNVCAAFCATNQAIASTDPACAPLSCPTGQIKTGDNCFKDCSTQVATIGNQNSVYTMDACGSNPVMEGCHYTATNCRCGTVTAGGQSSTTCYAWGALTPLGTGVLIGPAGQTTSSTPLPPSNVNSTIENAPPPPDGTVTCPAGYSFISPTGVCQSAGTPGTAATSTSPATPGTPGAITCPVGSSLQGTSCIYAGTLSGIDCPVGHTKNANGQCENLHDMTGAVGTGTCPQGYTRSGGICTSNTATTGDCPAGYNKNPSGFCQVNALDTPVAECGVEGRPACIVKTEEDAAACGGAGQPACPEMFSDTGIELIDGIVNGFAESKGAYFSWVWTPPIGTCEPITGTIHGVSASMDLCPTINNLRDLLGWIFGVFGAWSIYGNIFKRADA